MFFCVIWKKYQVTYAVSTFTKKLYFWSYNQLRNTLRLFDILPSFPFTTSETMGDYYLWTWYMQVTLPIAERLKEIWSTPGNWEIPGEYPIPIEWYPSAQTTRQIEYFANPSKELLKNRNFTSPIVRYLTRKPELLSNIPWPAESRKAPHTSSINAKQTI